ncbi:MAG: protein-L-isoaspartate(D-aspartate) O-methyltransferase [Burkholderiaceae bacterium]
MSDGAPRGKRFPAQWGAAPSAARAAPGGAREPLRPQRLLHQAAQDAARQVVPSGRGLDNPAVRERMVARLRAEGIRAPALLAAFGAVPRHLFVDTALGVQAYEDTSLPIGLGQTISKPSVVARQLQWLFDAEAAAARGHLGRVLEIGTGCGYQTALLARLARTVISIERLQPLHQLARRNLDAVGVPGVRLVHGDGRHGHPPNAPYDSIVAAAGGEAIPDAWLQQLAPGGRLVAPTAMPGLAGQALVIVDRTPGGFVRQVGESVTFVPLKSGIG